MLKTFERESKPREELHPTQLLINYVLSAAPIENINYFSKNDNPRLHLATLKFIKGGACVRDALIDILARSHSNASSDGDREHGAACHLLRYVVRGDYSLLQAWCKQHDIGACIYSSSNAAGREVRNWLHYAHGREDEILLRHFVNHCQSGMPHESYFLLSKPDDLALTFWFFLLEPSSVQNFLSMLTKDEIKKCISSRPDHPVLANIVYKKNSQELIAYASAYLARLAALHVIGEEGRPLTLRNG